MGHIIYSCNTKRDYWDEEIIDDPIQIKQSTGPNWGTRKKSVDTALQDTLKHLNSSPFFILALEINPHWVSVYSDGSVDSESLLSHPRLVCHVLHQNQCLHKAVLSNISNTNCHL